MSEDVRQDDEVYDRIRDIGGKFLHFKDDNFTVREEELISVFRAMKAIIDKEEDNEAEIMISDSDSDDVDLTDKKQNSKSKFRPEVFENVGRKVGTHSLKLVNTRATEHVLSFGNTAPAAFSASGYAGVVKLLFRQIRSDDGQPRSVHTEILRIAKGENHSPLLDAATKVLGDDIINSFRDGLKVEKTIKNLNEAVPILFIPDHDMNDIQITPISTVASFSEAQRVRGDFLFPKENKIIDKEGKTPRRRGSFSSRALTDKMANVSVMIGGQRVRLHASFPNVMGERDAHLHRYVKGGSFPRIDDHELTDKVIKLASLLSAISPDDEKKGAGRKPELVSGAENLARFLANQIYDHVFDTLESVDVDHPSFSPSQINIKDILVRSIRTRGESDEDKLRRSSLQKITSETIFLNSIKFFQEKVDDEIAVRKNIRSDEQ